MSKKKKPSKKKKKPSMSISSAVNISRIHWVDGLDFESPNASNSGFDMDRNATVAINQATIPNDVTNRVSNDDNDSQHERLDVRIVSWNVLAHAYLSRRSHKNLPPSYEHVVFHPQRRNTLIQKVLSKLIALNLDIICLQEVDLPIVETLLKERNFEGVSSPTIVGGGAGGRVDACCIYWNLEDWTLVHQDIIRFDDLATLGSKIKSTASMTSVDPGSTAPTDKSDLNMQGIQQSFLRRNVAVLVRLQHRTYPSVKIVVCNSHFFWNPEYSYVKLCQAHYASERTFEFSNGDPIVFCGDLNSKPGSHVHQYLTSGTVHAKSLAPWYCNQQQDNQDIFLHEGKGLREDDDSPKTADQIDAVMEQFDALDIQSSSAEIKYMLDFTLNRFARWLRILGVDAALETEAEEIQRTKHSNFVIFERCRLERRCLITTSTKLVVRKGCPPGVHFINRKAFECLEEALVHLLLSHGVVLEPQKFLSRCVVCNGGICDVTDKEEKKRIFAAYQAPDLVSEDLECYECNGCGQGYWWCDRPTSSASRVKGKATLLFELCLRGGVAIKGPLSMFDSVNVEEERKKGQDFGSEMCTLQVLEWLKKETLRCPIQLESSYASKTKKGVIVGECKPFTNVTSDFVGFLDYVLFDPEKFRLDGRLFLPSSFNELKAGCSERNGHLLPSSFWPSDHLAVGAQLSIAILSEDKVPSSIVSSTDSRGVVEHPLDSKVDSSMFCGVVTEEKSMNVDVTPPPLYTFPQPSHQPRCACGCVPNIPSLFEMAELRKQAKLRAQQDSGNQGT